MKVVVLGKGNMGLPLSVLATHAGHRVECFDSRTSPVAAVQDADIVVIAMKYEKALALGQDEALMSAMAGKILVDITNPLSSDFMSLTIGHTTSAAEEIARSMPGVRVVKALNTIFAALLQRRAEGHHVEIPVFVAGDHQASVQAVADLVKSMGFSVVVAGPLSNARYLEPMAEFMIQLGYGCGHGDRIGFALKHHAPLTAPVN